MKPPNIFVSYPKNSISYTCTYIWDLKDRPTIDCSTDYRDAESKELSYYHYESPNYVLNGLYSDIYLEVLMIYRTIVVSVINDSPSFI